MAKRAKTTKKKGPKKRAKGSGGGAAPLLVPMSLGDYNIDPHHINMPATSIAFREIVDINGDDAANVLQITFNQINSPNWLIVSPLSRNIPINRAGTHTIDDTLSLSLKPGKQRVQEYIVVNSSASLQSNPGQSMPASIGIVVVV